MKVVQKTYSKIVFFFGETAFLLVPVVKAIVNTSNNVCVRRHFGPSVKQNFKDKVRRSHV